MWNSPLLLPKGLQSMVFSDYNTDNNDRPPRADGEYLDAKDDLLVEQIIENINTTPIGQVLKRIASMPEVRKEKVIDVRSKICKGDYELRERLDVAIDKILEELII
jgi:hypothetical protein